MMGPYRPFTEVEREAAQVTLKAYYDRFLGVVSEGRKLSLEQVEQLARGRVWLATDALERRLVDRHAGLWDAIGEARAAAGVGDDEDVDLVYVGTLGALSSLQRLIGGVLGFADEVTAAQRPALPAELGELAAVYGALAGGGPLALQPFILKIE
jgi:protease-4